MDTPRLKHTLAAFGAVASLVAACGGTGAPSPSPTVAPSVAASATTAPAASPSKAAVTYAKTGTIAITPTNSASFDVALVDPKTHTLYLADRTTKGVDIIVNEKYVRTVSGMVGVGAKSAVSGPNGLALVPDKNEIWAGDGDSTVKVIDLGTNAIVASIPTGGKGRADEMAYDSKDKILMVANDSEDTPFLTFISTTDRKILGKLEFPGAGGLEEPEYDEAAGIFWQSVPATKTNPQGEIDQIDPKAMKIVKTFPEKECMSNGITFGPKGVLGLVCNGDAIAAGFKAQTQFIDTSNGNLLGKADIGGGDLMVYDANANVYFVADSNMTSDGTKAGTAAPALGIIDGKTYALLQKIPTKKSAHSVAIDTSNGHVYVPVPDDGIWIITKGQ